MASASKRDKSGSSSATRVEYALPGVDAQLFVSRYQLELPKKDELERFLTAQVSSLGVDLEGAGNSAAGPPAAPTS